MSIKYFLLLLIIKTVCLWGATTLQTDSIYALDPYLWLRAKWMPLYGALVQFAGLFEFSVETAARILSALAASALFFPLVKLNKHMWGQEYAGLSFLILAVHPVIFRWGSLVLNDMLFVWLLLMALSSFVRGRWFPLWVCLAALTRPEGLILLPGLFFWHFYRRSGLWVSTLGALIFAFWAFRMDLFMALGFEEPGTGRFVLGFEFLNGLILGPTNWWPHLLATFLMWVIFCFPMIFGSSAFKKVDNTSLLLIILGLWFALWILPSLTPHWSGRRVLPLVVLSLPFVVRILHRRQYLSFIFISLCCALSFLTWRDLKNEYSELRQACLWLKEQSWQGEVFTDDLRRTQWWLGRPCKRYRGESLEIDKRYILLSRKRQLPKNALFESTASWHNLYGDGIWLYNGQGYSLEPPHFLQWGTLNQFRAGVY